MGIDTGKLGKRMGHTHPKNARKVDQDPLRVPPHKKPRTYRLTLSYERVTKTTHTKEFMSKAEMQAFRLRVERVLAEQAELDESGAARRRAYYSGFWNLKMHEKEEQKFKTKPVISEEMIEGSPSEATDGR